MSNLPKSNKNKRNSLMPTWINKKRKNKDGDFKDKPPTIEYVNTAKPYEKIIFKNTTTRSIEKIDSDGSYINAVETKEEMEERIKYANSISYFDKSNIIDINPVEINEPKPSSEEISLATVSQNPFALEFVINQTHKICEAALYRNGLALEFVRDKTASLCLLALSQNSQAIRYVPIHLLSSSIDLSDYVFICVGSKVIIPSVPRINGLNRINLPYNDNNFCLLNALKYNEGSVNFIVEKQGYIDDDFINDLKRNNNFVVVLNSNTRKYL